MGPKQLTDLIVCFVRMYRPLTEKPLIQFKYCVMKFSTDGGSLKPASICTPSHLATFEVATGATEVVVALSLIHI